MISELDIKENSSVFTAKQDLCNMVQCENFSS